jgi:hypothetical protein
MVSSILRIAVALTATGIVVSMLRRDHAAAVVAPAAPVAPPVPATASFVLEAFEQVAVDGSVLLRVTGEPMIDPQLVIDGPMGLQVLEPLLGEQLRGAAVGFAAGADDVAASKGYALRTADGEHPLPAPTERSLKHALQVARAAA